MKFSTRNLCVNSLQTFSCVTIIYLDNYHVSTKRSTAFHTSNARVIAFEDDSVVCDFLSRLLGFVNRRFRFKLDARGERQQIIVLFGKKDRVAQEILYEHCSNSL